MPKTRIYRMCREGEVRVNGKRIEPAYRLAEGGEVRIPPVRVADRSDKAPVRVIKSLLDRVIYRDDSILVIDKPAGMAVHGGSGVSQGVIEKLRVELPDARFLELVHRLDRETSGVLVLALKRSALVEMHRKLREGETNKHYLTLAEESRTPILLYNIPQNTGISLEPRLVVELAPHPNIVGLKESSGSLGFLCEVIREVPESFHYFLGSGHVIHPGLEMGACGAILGDSCRDQPGARLGGHGPAGRRHGLIEDRAHRGPEPRL